MRIRVKDVLKILASSASEDQILANAQLPPSLAGFLRTVSEEAIACRDAGLQDAAAGEMWRFAIAGRWCEVVHGESFHGTLQDEVLARHQANRGEPLAGQPS